MRLLSMSSFASMRVPCNGNQDQPSKLRQLLARRRTD